VIREGRLPTVSSTSPATHGGISRALKQSEVRGYHARGETTVYQHSVGGEATEESGGLHGGFGGARALEEGVVGI